MRLRLILAVLLAAFLGWAAWRLKPALAVAAGLTSHELCDGVFVADQAPDVVFRTNLAPRRGYHRIAWAVRYRVDRARASVTSSLFGLFSTQASYREGFGCLVLHGAPPVEQAAALPQLGPALLSPLAGPNVVTPQSVELKAALDAAFTENPTPPYRHTEAVVVVHYGRIVAERYAPGIGPQTPLIGYSATKSVISALIGILVRDKKLSLYGPAPVALWAAGGDKRHAISIDDLLSMRSGLDFPETGSGLDVPSRMLFLSRDMAAYAERSRLKFPPGTHWCYSSASYLILSQVVRNAVGGGPDGVLAFARRELFGPLGMVGVRLDFDATGTPVGSTYMLAPARSWARFGLLYLDDGVVDGQRILPAGWVRYSTMPSPGTGYGAGFWTERLGQAANPHEWGLPGIPADAFMARGILGQYVVVVPSKNLIVVRLGLSDEGGRNVNDTQGTGRLVAAVAAAVGD
jgi:CubicO group peptidase (beta-lactamase class C family)